MANRKAEKTTSLETDLVVIGGGWAGLAAAVAAAENGAEVVVLEKGARWEFSVRLGNVCSRKPGSAEDDD